MTRIIRPYPGFIIPTRRFVDVGMPRSGVSMKGRYQIRVLDAYGIEKRRTPWFDNIILDSGLNRWGTGPVILGAAISTGTATPAATDTDLQVSPYHYTTTAGTGHNSITAGVASNYNNTRTFVYRTTLGALNGNYTEVGVGWVSGSMFSRALILDGGGTPTPLSVSSSEQLDIYYQLSIYPPLVDIGPTTITISGVNYDVTGRAAYVTATTNTWAWAVPSSTFSLTYASGGFAYPSTTALGAITSGLSGSGTSATSNVTNAYSNLSLQRTGSITCGLTEGNASGGIKGTIAWWSSLGTFQYVFSPVIPKDGTKTLVLNYSVTWARR